MSFTGAIGSAGNRTLKALVGLLAITRIHPNVFTCVGLLINAAAAWLLSQGEFTKAGVVVLFAAVFDLVDGPLARHSGRVTRFGGFLDSVIDRYSDLILLMGMLVYYASINRFGYIVLTAVAMAGSVMVSYTRARAENEIPKCKVGFLERPERIVLIIIGSLSNRMAPVLWVIAVLANWTVIQRVLFTWTETERLGQEPAATKAATAASGKSEEAKAGREHSLGYPSA
jgi:CDP-diacylglycerol--glycerol-3-phosphate 3-phosphatidyltransferase